MKLVEVSGDAKAIGRATGEALRDEIRDHLERFPQREHEKSEWSRRLPAFLDTLKAHLPEVLAEMDATAEGAGVPVEEIYRLNLPLYPNSLVVDEGCTNVAFADGPDGPVWGKNNDGGKPHNRRPPCARVVKRDDAIPNVVFTFCGMVATTDGMNAEGLAVGHSSVGSVFQQSDRHVPIRPWAYEAMLACRTTEEFVRFMASRPTRGKGYSMVCVDRKGVACSVEAPCPIVQVRRPEGDVPHTYCVNCYLSRPLTEADRRKPEGKVNALSRSRFFQGKLAEPLDFSVADMKAILRHHGDPSICRHGGKDLSFTEYSMIGLPQERRVLYLDGSPCEKKYLAVGL